MMRSSLLLPVLTLVTWCSAQVTSFGALPDCAKPCANNLPTGCNLDVKCICADTSFISGISCCVAKACSDADVQKTLQVASQLCDTVNVKLPSAVPATCAHSTGGTTSAAAPMSEPAAGNSISNATPTMSGSSATGSPSKTTSATGSMTSAGSVASNSNGATVHHVGSRVGALGAAVAALALF